MTQGVGNAVGQMVERAQLVRHGVAHAQNALAKAIPAMQAAFAMFSRALGSFAPFS